MIPQTYFLLQLGIKKKPAFLFIHKQPFPFCEIGFDLVLSLHSRALILLGFLKKAIFLSCIFTQLDWILETHQRNNLLHCFILMDSPQSVVSPLRNSSTLSEYNKQNGNLVGQKSDFLTREKVTATGKSEDSLPATLEVYIHQARDIHNICIYQKQDVYAKLCLTSDPENTVSTKIINGGGRNPVFNENLHLNVHKVDSSLKCEIWMLSRIHNYMDDQMLGFALVPVSDILMNDGKLEKEFSLSSTDLFHSPAGFVQLSVSYVGVHPEVIPITSPQARVENDSIAQEMDRIEFPDPEMANENDKMVAEYISLPCSNLESSCSDSLVSSDMENNKSGESFVISRQCQKTDSPLSSVSTNATSAYPPVRSQSCETPEDSRVSHEEHVSPFNDGAKEKFVNAMSTSPPVSSQSCETPKDSRVSHEERVSHFNDDANEKNAHAKVDEPSINEVVQQDIVDMYMKSMQQFTDSLAKMKLPMDFESGTASSTNSSSDPKSPTSKNSGSRVFYGSRAFF